MEANASTLVFTEVQIGAIFLTVFCAGLLVAAAAFLLRPWPPARKGIVRFVGIAVLCGAGLVYASFRREVQIDPAQGLISERVSYVGLGPDRAAAFTEFQSVQVECRADCVRDELSLQRAQEPVRLWTFEDGQAAENAARSLGRIGAWPLLRRGYRVQSSLPQLGAGLAGGAVETFTMPDGRGGMSVALQDLLRFIPAPGQESVIAP